MHAKATEMILKEKGRENNNKFPLIKKLQHISDGILQNLKMVEGALKK